MGTLTPELQTIKEKMKDVWSAGDFGIIAKIIMPEGEAFINRLKIKPGSKVLDVACGSGNLSLSAARMDATVTGIDIVPDLIRQAKERAALEKLDIRFDVGDAEDLPYQNNTFDYVVTMFGAIFAPRPEVAVNELLRVCKSGGTIAMANWTSEGFVGEFFKLTASYLPPPEGIPPPILWGNEEIVKERFAERVSDLELRRTILKMIMPFQPAEVAEHYIKYFGPTKIVYSSLDETTQMKFMKEFTELWEDNNVAHDNTTIVDAEYLEVIAIRG